MTLFLHFYIFRVSNNGIRNGSNDLGGLQTSVTESLGSGSVSSTATSGGDDNAVSSNVASTLNLSLRSSPATVVTTEAYTTGTDSSKSDEDGEYQSHWKMPAEQLVITEKTPREEREERRQRTLVEASTASYPIHTTQVPPSSTHTPSPKILGNNFGKDVPRYYFGSASPSPVSMNSRSAFPAFQSIRRTTHDRVRQTNTNRYE